MPSFLFCSIFLLFSILLFSMDVLNGAYLLMMLVHLCFPLLAKWMIENLSFSRSFDTLVMFIVVVVEHTFQKEKSLSNPSKSLIFSSSFIECIVMVQTVLDKLMALHNIHIVKCILITASTEQIELNSVEFCWEFALYFFPSFLLKLKKMHF